MRVEGVGAFRSIEPELNFDGWGQTLPVASDIPLQVARCEIKGMSMGSEERRLCYSMGLESGAGSGAWSGRARALDH